MPLIYTNYTSKKSKKQLAARAELLKEQRAIKRSNKVNAVGITRSKPYVRTTPVIPSLDSGIGNAAKKETQMYTGDKMIGIGQLHKSNAVPVFKQEEAKELASMRR